MKMFYFFLLVVLTGCNSSIIPTGTCYYDFGIVEDSIYQYEFSACSQQQQFGIINCDILGGYFKTVVKRKNKNYTFTTKSKMMAGEIYRISLKYLSKEEVDETKNIHSEDNVNCSY